MGERLGYSDPKIEELIKEVKGLKDPVARTIAESESRRDEKNVTKGETAAPEAEKKSTKRRQKKMLVNKVREPQAPKR